MIHMIIGLCLAIAATQAFASDRITTIKLSSSENFEFYLREYADARYIADNKACFGLVRYNKIQLPVRKQKRIKYKLTKNEISFENVPEGVCRYTINDLVFGIVLDNKLKLSAVLVHDENASNEGTIICRIEESKYLNCRPEDGKYNESLFIPMNLESKGPKTVHIELE